MSEAIYFCPFCGDGKGHLYLNFDKDVYNCFKCGIRGRISSLTYTTIMSLQRKRDCVERPDSTPDAQEAPGYDLETYEGTLRPVPVTYLASRGLGMEAILKYHLRYSPEDNTIWFPIYGVPGGSPLFWQGKQIGGAYMTQHTKLINFSLFRTFGIPTLVGRQKNVVLTEGVFDALSVSRVAPAVAGFGKNIPDSRLQVLTFLAENVIVLLDKDAQKEAIQTTLRLQAMGISAKRGNEQLLHKDPGDSSVEVISAVIGGESNGR